MKKTFLLFLFSALLLCNNNLFAQDKIASEIAYSLKTGNVSKLVTFLNSEIELQIKTNENIYSLAQAEIILKDFFQTNKPSSFEIIHEGKQQSSQYFIGKLTTINDVYRTYVFLKETNNKKLIYQLRFEVEHE